MIKEDKDLLLRDLSARLLYGVIVRLDYRDGTIVTREMGIGSFHDILFGNTKGKPYLRPMSSMTEEECKELKQVALVDNEGVPGDIPAYIDWLNKKMFDYRGLIPMRLALEAPEGMYKKEK